MSAFNFVNVEKRRHLATRTLLNIKDRVKTILTMKNSKSFDVKLIILSDYLQMLNNLLVELPLFN